MAESGKSANQRELVEYIAKALSSNQDAVFVTEENRDSGHVILLKVSNDDVGRVIGKNGRIARAIRTVMGVARGADSNHYSLDIAD